MADALLMILPYVPYPLRRGTYQRVFHLAEQVGKAFATDLFCLSEDPDDLRHKPVFEAFCRRVHFEPFSHPQWPRLFPDRLLNGLPTTVGHWWSHGSLESLAAFAKGHNYRLIHFCDIVLWPYIETLFHGHPRLVMDRSRVDWLFQTEELRTLKLSLRERLLRWENLLKMAVLERKVYRNVALEVVCGLDDRTFLKQRLGDDQKVFVLPNGYNESYFNPGQWPRELTPQPTALFCGALDYTPNVDALRWYFESIHDRIRSQLPDFSLTLVGKSPVNEVLSWASRPGVNLVGEVPDVRPSYQKAWFQVVPLRIGGGTRLKIVESLGMGCPVVSTALGAQGLELADGKDLLLANTPEAFAQACLTLAADARLRRELECSGQATVLSKYRWCSLAEKLITRYKDLWNA